MKKRTGTRPRLAAVTIRPQRGIAGLSVPVELSRSRTALVFVYGLIAAGLLNAAAGGFLQFVYPKLMRVNSGSMDWSVPAFLGAILALALFPYRSVRRLPGWLTAIGVAVAGSSSVLVTLATEPPIGRAHSSIALALGAFVVSGTLKAMVAAALVRKPTGREVEQAAVELFVGAAGAVVFGALGGAVGGTAEAGDGVFDSGGGAFGGGGASGSW